MKWLAVFFAVFVILIIILADAGILPRYLGPIYDFPNGDKVGHFILYGILAFLVDLSLFRSFPDRSRKLIALLFGLILAFAITLEEISQQYIPSRTFSLFDLLMGYLGVAFFSWFALNWKQIEQR